MWGYCMNFFTNFYITITLTVDYSCTLDNASNRISLEVDDKNSLEGKYEPDNNK